MCGRCGERLGRAERAHDCADADEDPTPIALLLKLPYAAHRQLTRVARSRGVKTESLVLDLLLTHPDLVEPRDEAETDRWSRGENSVR